MGTLWPRQLLASLIGEALREDVGSGDITTWAALRGDEAGQARATAKSPLVVAGIEVFGAVFTAQDPALRFRALRRDGERVEGGEQLADVSGSLASILTAERVALNLFQRMCGIATITRRFVEAAAGTTARIIDTRKTVPGLRILDKYAVRIGGGHNHRFALYDGVLIKDNHIAAAGGVAEAVRRARAFAPPYARIEVETENEAQVREALAAGADLIMLDNMTTEEMRRMVEMVGGRAKLEASGNITAENVLAVAETGVDYISVGALTHSAPALDLSLEIEAAPG